MFSRSSPIKRLTVLPWLFGLGWTLLLIALFVLFHRQESQHLSSLAAHRALHHFERDSAIRVWASKHGGVYVPVSDRTPPNPNLQNIPMRDITAPDGRALTLMNPAYILRQMAEEYPDPQVVRHITSLDPIRAENAPDSWERKALESFERGTTEVIEVSERNQDRCLRFMRPFFTEKGCIKCHQNYREGSVRGGISVSISLAPYEALGEENTRLAGLTFGGLWILGLGFIRFVANRQKLLLQDLEQIGQEKAHLSEQLAQSQKLEAIGTLAGGIAHDFNNLLTIILGNLEIIQMDVPRDGKLNDELSAIFRAAQKARTITQKLLGFSRRKPSHTQSVDLNLLIKDLGGTLSPLIGADFPVTYRFGENLPPITADPGEVEQVLLNLLVNARDAVVCFLNSDPERSRLIVVETRKVEIDESFTVRNPDMLPGSYVLMTVSDNGIGMSYEVQQRVFEPFFTTKEIGKGTGLGLATTWGIIKQHRGNISVYSEPGQGTTIRVYWPVAPREEAQRVVSSPASVAPLSTTGNETILVVDDEPDVRRFASLALHTFGYQALEAGNGREALEVITKHASRIRLVISDVIMPELNGPGLIGEMRRAGLTHPVLLVSGYSADLVSPDNLGPGVRFLQKPVSPQELALNVRKLLDAHSKILPKA